MQSSRNGFVVRSWIHPSLDSAFSVWYRVSDSTKQVAPAASQIRYWVRWSFSIMANRRTGESMVNHSGKPSPPGTAARPDTAPCRGCRKRRPPDGARGVLRPAEGAVRGSERLQTLLYPTRRPEDLQNTGAAPSRAPCELPATLRFS